MITVRSPSGDKSAASITVRTPAGDKSVARIVLRTQSGDKEVYSQALAGTLTLSAQPLSAIGFSSTGATAAVTSNEVAVTATGGTAPYTFAWSRVSGSTLITALSPAAAKTRFRAVLAPSNTADAVFKCFATDARGRTREVEVSVDLLNISRGF